MLAVGFNPRMRCTRFYPSRSDRLSRKSARQQPKRSLRDASCDRPPFRGLKPTANILRRYATLGVLVVTTLLGLAVPGNAEPLAFRDDDMVVLLGNTFIERAQQNGYLETQLTLATGEKNVRFRNLGWSGDTVFGTARSYFGPPKEGFERLTNQLSELRPNIVLVNYGAVAAFEGKGGIPEFLQGYRKMLDMIYEKAGPREIVLVSPPPAENLGPPLPDQSGYNQNLALYRDAIEKLAEERSLRFVDLFDAVASDKSLTNNGIHYTPEGYAAIAPQLTSQLGLKPADSSRSDADALERLRQTIIAKNRLYFHRWRPANETYLHLFRKHEQGQNARELPLFEPLVEAKELEIQVFKQLVLGK